MPSDPLLSALVAKLPDSDAEWPVERQLAWLNLMAMAFGVTYGGDAAARIGIKSSGIEAKPVEQTKPSPAPLPPPVVHKFIIDMDGRACTARGKPVMPSEINDVICDLRGPDGDVRTISWADGSTGIQGWDLVITA